MEFIVELIIEVFGEAILTIIAEASFRLIFIKYGSVIKKM